MLLKLRDEGFYLPTAAVALYGATPLHIGVATVAKRPMPGVAEALPRRCQDAGGHEFASARSIPAGNTRFAGGFFSRVRVSGRADAALKRLPTRTVNSR